MEYSWSDCTAGAANILENPYSIVKIYPTLFAVLKTYKNSWFNIINNDIQIFVMLLYSFSLYMCLHFVVVYMFWSPFEKFYKSNIDFLWRFFVFFGQMFPNVTPQSLFHLLFLCTYVYSQNSPFSNSLFTQP